MTLGARDFILNAAVLKQILTKLLCFYGFGWQNEIADKRINRTIHLQLQRTGQCFDQHLGLNFPSARLISRHHLGELFAHNSGPVDHLVAHRTPVLFGGRLHTINKFTPR